MDTIFPVFFMFSIFVPALNYLNWAHKDKNFYFTYIIFMYNTL